MWDVGQQPNPRQRCRATKSGIFSRTHVTHGRHHATWLEPRRTSEVPLSGYVARRAGSALRYFRQTSSLQHECNTQSGAEAAAIPRARPGRLADLPRRRSRRGWRQASKRAVIPEPHRRAVAASSPLWASLPTAHRRACLTFLGREPPYLTGSEAAVTPPVARYEFHFFIYLWRGLGGRAEGRIARCRCRSGGPAAAARGGVPAPARTAPAPCCSTTWAARRAPGSGPDSDLGLDPGWPPGHRGGRGAASWNAATRLSLASTIRGEKAPPPWLLQDNQHSI